MEQDEWLDLVDENDEVIGRKLRSEIYREHLSNFRAVGLFIKDHEGRIWVPRRVATKRIFPLALDMSCAGHVESGESYEQTLQREVQEELNIDIGKRVVKKLGLTKPSEGFSCFGMMYELESDDVPDYNRDDFFESYWLTPEEIVARIAAGDPAKSDLPLHIRRFYLSEQKISA